MEAAAQFIELIQKHMLRILSISLSKPAKKASSEQQGSADPIPAESLRVQIRPSTSASKQGSFSLNAFTKMEHKRCLLSAEELISIIRNTAGTRFLSCVLRYEEGDHTLSASLLTSKRRKQSLHMAREAPANRKISGIPEGRPVPFLERLGIMNAKGQVIASRSDKFRQINRFLLYIEDILPDLMRNRDKAAPLHIIDFGCGKSYLTFAVYYYFCVLKGIAMRITGIDRKQDVIEDCRRLAALSGYEGMEFSALSIEDFCAQAEKTASVLDLVISLHACDTATDYALAFAAKREARAILAVPCCQHELNAKLSACSPALASITHYGLSQERFAALATDVLRAEMLAGQGYKTQLLEFIDMSGTPKNLLIRALYTGKKDGRALRDAEALVHLLNAELTLPRLLKNPLFKRK